jgi:nitrate/nitrite transport system substrate-binding protein
MTKAASEKQPSRRDFVKTSVAALGAALLPHGRVWASDAPEVTGDMKFGMIALTDCSSIVIAHEKGFFKKYGINSVVSKGASWAAIRDSLSNGDLQGTHMLCRPLFGMIAGPDCLS